MRSLSLAVLGLCLSLVACGPIVMIPGGKLSGEVEQAPASWSFTDDVETFQLETRPDDPYSVNIWAIDVGGDLFVVAGSGPETTWAQHIAEDPRVRLRVDESIYELMAVEANDPTSRDAFLLAAKEKYDFDPDDEDTGKAVLYRLDPR